MLHILQWERYPCLEPRNWQANLPGIFRTGVYTRSVKAKELQWGKSSDLMRLLQRQATSVLCLHQKFPATRLQWISQLRFGNTIKHSSGPAMHIRRWNFPIDNLWCTRMLHNSTSDQIYLWSSSSHSSEPKRRLHFGETDKSWRNWCL